MELLHLIFKTIDTAKGYNVTNADQQDSGADKGGKGDGRHVRIAEAQDTQDDAGDTEEEKGPPVRESHFLVVEAVDGHKNAFHDDPNSEAATNRLLHRKMIPMMISKMALSTRLALLGRNFWVLKVKMSLVIPDNNVRQPMSQAVAKRVAAGSQMHIMPRAIRRTPEMPNQILLDFCIG